MPALSSWFQVYAPKKSKIQSILDLDGKRILVLERSVQQEAFVRLGKGFGLNSTLITVPDYNTMFGMVASEPGKGTTFKIYLPYHADEPQEIMAERVEEIPMNHGETLLVVEDEPAIMKMSKYDKCWCSHR